MNKPERTKPFAYPGAPGPKSLRDVIKWAVTRKKVRWPAWVENPTPSPIVKRVHGAGLRVTFVNHATVLIQTHGFNILTDPVWSKRVSPSKYAGPTRVRNPGIDFDALPRIDVVLVSHNHYDHYDVRTLSRLWREHQPLFLMPLRNAQFLQHKHPEATVIELDWQGTQIIDVNTIANEDHKESITAELIPTLHWSSRSGFDANRSLWGGYVLHTPSGKLYFGGDSGFGNGEPFLEAQQRFDCFRFALLPIGAYEPRWFMREQHMNPDEAVRAHKALSTTYSMGIHFGTWQLTDEGIDEPEHALAVARVDHGVDPCHFRTLLHGEAWDVPEV